MNRQARELRAVMTERAGAGELKGAISRAVAPVVPHDAMCLVGSSPAAGYQLWSFSFWHGYEPDFGRALVQHCYAGDSPYLPDELARQPIPAGVIGTRTGGARRDRLTRRLFRAHGIGCELRLLLRDHRGVWGMLSLLREPGGRPFNDHDVQRAARLGPTLKAALRGYLTAGPLAPARPALPPGVLIIGPDHKVRATTPQADRWRDELQLLDPGVEWNDDPFIVGLSIQARSRARGPEVSAPLVVGPATHGRWIACNGQPLNGDGTGDVAIVIQAATGEQMLPSFCDWYGITAREREIIGQLRDGAAYKQIARRLSLSVHTVNDYLKAVYRKTGASGRDELLAAFTA